MISRAEKLLHQRLLASTLRRYPGTGRLRDSSAPKGDKVGRAVDVPGGLCQRDVQYGIYFVSTILRHVFFSLTGVTVGIFVLVCVSFVCVAGPFHSYVLLRLV